MTFEMPKGFIRILGDIATARGSRPTIQANDSSYNVEFQQMNDEGNGQLIAKARAFSGNQELMAETPWQKTDIPRLSAVFALRHMLETFDRPLFKPNAGDIARLNVEGEIVTCMVQDGLTYKEEEHLNIYTDYSAFVDGDQVLVSGKPFNLVSRKRFLTTNTFETVKAWNYRGSPKENTGLEFFVNKPVWLIYS